MANLPDFVCLGVPRAGTTWLYSVLSSHPEVYIPEKELHFFLGARVNISIDLYKTKGIDWYLRFYANAPNDRKKGDIGSSYFRSEIARKRIVETLPGRKMILMIRNPIERAWSDYRLRISSGSFSGTFEQLLEHDRFGPRVLDDGIYARHIIEWQKVIKDEDMLFIFLDEVASEPMKTYSRICKYLDISDTYRPSNLDQKINEPEGVRLKALSDVHFKFASYMSRNDLWSLKQLIKKTGIPKIIYDLNHKRSRKEDMSEREFQILKKYYQAEIAELEQMFNRDLSHWHANVETR